MARLARAAIRLLPPSQPQTTAPSPARDPIRAQRRDSSSFAVQPARNKVITAGFDDPESGDSMAAMPTVLRIGPYRFHFYSSEGTEPAHIHVARDDFEAKFWLRPVELAANHGYRAAEMREITRLVEEHCEELVAAYVRAHGHN